MIDKKGLRKLAQTILAEIEDLDEVDAVDGFMLMSTAEIETVQFALKKCLDEGLFND